MSNRLDSKKRKLNTNEYQAADGRYIYQYTDQTGKTRRAYSWCLTTSDKPPKGKKCTKCLREIEAEIRDDESKGINTITAKKRTVDEQFEIFYRSKINKIKMNTLVNYRYMYEKFIQPRFGKLLIRDIIASNIRDFYDCLVNEHNFKPSTLENIHTVLYPLFDLAIDDDIIIKNPCMGKLKPYKQEKKQKNKITVRHAFSADQQNRFMDFVKAHKDQYARWYNLLVFFIGTGCRVSEMCGLTWDDVDLKRNIITIDHQLKYSADETGKFNKSIDTPKSRAGYRTIPIHPDVKEALLDEWQRQKNDNLISRETVTGIKYINVDYDTEEVSLSNFVFLNRFGDCLLPHNTNKAFERIRKSYNEYETELAKKENREPKEMPHFSNHYLRHTAATRFCETIADKMVVSSMMGHEDLKTTMIYNHTQDDYKTKVTAAAWDNYRIG